MSALQAFKVLLDTPPMFCAILQMKTIFLFAFIDKNIFQNCVYSFYGNKILALRADTHVKDGIQTHLNLSDSQDNRNLGKHMFYSYKTIRCCL